MPFVGELDSRWVAPLKRKLLAEFTYIDHRGDYWKVPEGYITDGASIPRFAWTFTGGPFSGLYLKPAIPHDFLCQMKEIPRAKADRIFLEAMKDEGVNWFKRWYMYRAVRGMSTWIAFKGWFKK